MDRIRFAVLILFSLASCTTYRAYQKGNQYAQSKDWDKAVMEYSKAEDLDPDNLKYRVALQRAKLEASREHFEKAKSLMTAMRYDAAMVELEAAVRLDPTNQWAAVEMLKASEKLRNSRAGDQDSIEKIKKRAKSGKAQPPTLNPSSEEPISLSFPRETSVKDIYRALGNAFGINILFDQAIKDDRISIELREVTAQQALERVMQAANHFYKVLDEKSIIVIPDNPQTRRDYEDLVIRTFYLSNGDAEQVTNVVRTMIEARNVFPLKALNAITIRDTADRVLIAEKIIESNDKARAEIVVDVELLQLNANKARDIGVTLGNLSGSAGLFTTTTTGTPPVTSVTPRTLINLPGLRNISENDINFAVPTILYSFIKNSSDAQVLARPQLRISEGEKATLHIGQRIPVPVSTFTSANPGQGNTFAPVTSFQYQDIGIKISMEPRVHHNRETSLKLSVEVSSQDGFAEGTIPPQPIIGTRTIESTIRLKDGETNFLAGLIRTDESTSQSTIPFVGDIPILGRLFTRDGKKFNRTDLVLTMTPHIIRIPDITDDDVAPMWVGTSNNLTFRGVSPRLESQGGIDPFTQSPIGNEDFNQQFKGAAEAGPDSLVAPSTNAAPASPRRPNLGFVPPTGTGPGGPGSEKPPGPQSNAIENQPPEEPRHDYGVRFSPRIAPQPMTLALHPGEEKIWEIVGMDIEGLTTGEIRLRFNSASISVSNVTLGTAFQIDPNFPPAVNIYNATGLVTITSSSDQPLKFRSGGELLRLHVRGALTGNSNLAIETETLTDSRGRGVVAALAGGRARVE